MSTQILNDGLYVSVQTFIENTNYLSVHKGICKWATEGFTKLDRIRVGRGLNDLDYFRKKN